MAYYTFWYMCINKVRDAACRETYGCICVSFNRICCLYRQNYDLQSESCIKAMSIGFL